MLRGRDKQLFSFWPISVTFDRNHIFEILNYFQTMILNLISWNSFGKVSSKQGFCTGAVLGLWNIQVPKHWETKTSKIVFLMHCLLITIKFQNCMKFGFSNIRQFHMFSWYITELRISHPYHNFIYNSSFSLGWSTGILHINTNSRFWPLPHYWICEPIWLIWF